MEYNDACNTVFYYARRLAQTHDALQLIFMYLFQVICLAHSFLQLLRESGLRCTLLDVVTARYYLFFFFFNYSSLFVFLLALQYIFNLNISSVYAFFLVLPLSLFPSPYY